MVKLSVGRKGYFKIFISVNNNDLNVDGCLMNLCLNLTLLFTSKLMIATHVEHISWSG